MPVQPTGLEIVTSTKFIWRITNFTQLTEEWYYSGAFKIDNYSWQILIYPKGYNCTDYLSLYLVVADLESLPTGRNRIVKFSLTVVNQRTAHSSVKCELCRSFSASASIHGSQKMITLERVRNDWFMVNDTIILEAGFDCSEADVVEDTPTEKMDSYFSSLKEYMSGIKDVPIRCLRWSPSDAGSPTLDEVDNAKRSLKECLSDLFKLNMKDRLAEALSTLSRAEVGLSASQSSSVQAFWDRFGEFTSDFLSFELDNAEYDLQKLLRDQMFSEMNKCHEKHVMFKKLSEKIAEEEEEYKTKMKEIRKRKEKLESDWEVLLAESQEAKYQFAEHEMKAKEAKEKKRIAEERMSRSTTAWSSLKAEFI